MREQGVFHLEEHGQTERSQWVLDSPNPPPLWKKLFSSVKETILPHGNKFCFSSKRKTINGHALSCLQNLFPIISWLRDYKVSKFKDDLLAGLTLASLCIPQVFCFTNDVSVFFFPVQCIQDKLKDYIDLVLSFFCFPLESCRA